MLSLRAPRVVMGAAAAGAAALVIGIGALAGSGPEPQAAAAESAAGSPGAKAQAYCDRFVGHLAAALGKSESDVHNAIKKASGETIDDAVKAGDLTREQADRLRDRLSRAPACAGPLAGIGKHHRRGTTPPSMRGYFDAAAKALGITVAELKTDLARGMTLHQVADSKGITEAQFRTALIRNLKPALDAAVKDGKLTADQEKAILDRLQNRPLPLWDRGFKRRPAPTPSPGATS